MRQYRNGKIRYLKISAVVLFLGLLHLLFINTAPEHRTGMLNNTPEQMRLLQQQKIVKVRPNELALKRKNQELLRQGKKPLDLKPARNTDEEISAELSSGGAATPTEVSTASGSAISANVDNSLLPAFPPIGNQGNEGSCVAWAITYYQSSHATCLVRGCNNKTLGATTFSPRWTYNMINRGVDGGSYFGHAFSLMTHNGATDLITQPYVAGNYRVWNRNPEHWKQALRYKMNAVQYYSVPLVKQSDTDFDQIKQLLSNGHVLSFGTYINSWRMTVVGADPQAASNPFAGQHAASAMLGTNGGHGMVLVGYDDNIWIDVNGNGSVDNNEKGAFKVANSWGAGWRNAGFIWLAYDAVYSTTTVVGGPTGKVGAFNNGGSNVYLLTAKPSYNPTLVAQFTVNNSNRGALSLRAGSSATSATTPSTYATTGALINQGGAYGFDGSTSSVDGIFVLDLSSLASSTSTLNYYLSATNSSSTSPLTIYDFKLINLAQGTEASAPSMPYTVSASTLHLPISHNFANGRAAPTAVISAIETPIDGGNLSVDFDGSGSFDNNTGGGISSYVWDFGDGSAQMSGAIVNHVYSKQGTFTVKLTVTNNFGLVASSTRTIKIADTLAPTAPMNLAASVSTVKTGRGKKATTTTVVKLTWSASQDNMGITGYRIYRNGILIATVSGTTLNYQDNATSAGIQYTYSVQAVDASANASVMSNAVIISR